jgi:protein-disulfide isomerase/peroxiredoxin/uncharacterized membrane protein
MAKRDGKAKGSAAGMTTSEQAAVTSTWLRVVWGLLSVATLAALYLLWGFVAKHLNPDHVSWCTFSATFDCDKLNLSTWGKIGGIPITVFAIPVYAALAVLARYVANGGARARGALTLMLVGAGAAVAFGLVLLWVMIFREELYCLFCLAMDASTLGVLLMVLKARKDQGPGVSDLGGVLKVPVAVGALAFVLLFGWFHSRSQTFEEAKKAEVSAGVDLNSAAPAVQLAASGDAGEKARKIDERNYFIPIKDSDASKGPKDAKVTIVEFADFQCGYCKKLFYSLTPLKEKYKDEVRFVFKHFPMNTTCNDTIKNNRHRYACGASFAAECARRQGRFWEMHDLMFKNQHKLKPADLRYYAGETGLNLADFDQCLGAPATLEHIKADISMAADIEISGTPRTYVNGRFLRGAVPQSTLEHVIEQELGRRAANERPQRVASPSVASKADVAEAPESVRVDYGTPFWIDSFEGSVDSAGRALSQAGAPPANVTWYEAKEACEAAGKRLCTTREWVEACQGTAAVDDDNTGSYADDYVEGNQFPYADYYEPRWCRDSEDRKLGKPGPTGSMPRCATPSGVYDLGGNVAEWAGATEEQAVLLGGNYRSKDKSGCFRPNATFGPGHKNIGIGFRCCADSKVAATSAKPISASAPVDMIGKKLPEFTGDLSGGGQLSTSDFKGKVTYLTFYASWCGPCRKELPALVGLQDRYENKEFQIVAVGVDTVAKKAEIFAKRSKVDYPVVLDPRNHILGMFDVVSMPTSYLIDRDGIIRFKKVGFGDKTIGEIVPEIEKAL